MPGRTPEGDALTALVLPVFALNGEFLEAAAAITAPHELTPARWRVLGAVLDEPLPVAEIARRVGLGLSRQSVQRVANDVVARGWAHWRPNPGRRGQNLLGLTARGRRAVAALATQQHAWADAVGQEIGERDLRTLAALISRVTDASRRYRQATNEGSHEAS
ncbi:MarR family transcriptional regulator [Actinomyces sp. ZJ308]|uniref:MarR family winged helix-turn-helix transcriptional regulator n=1 Tax=Actinomyces sp. ZJ308 TaxID=2708342 RepID=UPI00141E03FF|nr:MarR family transcriptional regulator [Actinomyces sp. ZJ308]